MGGVGPLQRASTATISTLPAPVDQNTHHTEEETKEDAKPEPRPSAPCGSRGSRPRAGAGAGSRPQKHLAGFLGVRRCRALFGEGPRVGGSEAG